MHRVVARPPELAVGTAADPDHVVALAALDHVIAVTPAKQVVALTASDPSLPAPPSTVSFPRLLRRRHGPGPAYTVSFPSPAATKIVAGECRDRVVPGGAGQRVPCRVPLIVSARATPARANIPTSAMTSSLLFMIDLLVAVERVAGLCTTGVIGAYADRKRFVNVRPSGASGTLVGYDRESRAPPRDRRHASASTRSTEPEGSDVLAVTASSLNPIDIATGTGRFYGGVPETPYVIGSEAVGRTADGRRVWYYAKRTIAERIAPVDPELAIEIPEGVDDHTALACGTAGLTGWLAVSWRARVTPEDTVLVLGASGTRRRDGRPGREAPRRGPSDRRRAPVEAIPDAADEAIALDGSEELPSATVIVDALWGEPAAHALAAAARGARFVQLGQSAGAEIPIASAWIRGKMAQILGLSLGSIPADVRARGLPRAVQPRRRRGASTTTSRHTTSTRSPRRGSARRRAAAGVRRSSSTSHRDGDGARRRAESCPARARERDAREVAQRRDPRCARARSLRSSSQAVGAHGIVRTSVPQPGERTSRDRTAYRTAAPPNDGVGRSRARAAFRRKQAFPVRRKPRPRRSGPRRAAHYARRDVDPAPEPLNVWDYERLAAERLDEGTYGYFAGGADDE